MNSQAGSADEIAVLGRTAAAETLAALLRHQDETFIKCAYLTLLRRDGDPKGIQHFLEKLRTGTPKVQILDELMRSPEGRSKRVMLPGLAGLLRRHKLTQLPMIGGICRVLFPGERYRPRETQPRTNRRQGPAPRPFVRRLPAIIARPQFVLWVFVRECYFFVLKSPRQHRGAAALRGRSLGAPNDVSEMRIRDTRIFPGSGLGGRVIYLYVDHTVQCRTNTGLQRVARSLAKALLAAGERVVFVKWDGEKQDIVLISRAELDQFSKWNGPQLPPAEAEAYSTVASDSVIVGSHSLAEGSWLIVPEVTYITPHAAPVTLDLLAASRRKGLWSLFVYYDSIPLRRREFAAAASSHETYTTELLLADLVTPISEWTARDLVSFFLVHDCAALSPTPKIIPILLPGASLATPRVKAPTGNQGCEHMILSVGTIEARKNQATLLNAFRTFCNRNPESDWTLVLVGNLHPDTASELARATAHNKSIRYLRHVPDHDLETLYSRCAFTAFPSVEEGFGLPIQESLWFGKPCVCANFGAMAEAALGGGCLMVDTRDERALCDAITSLIESPELLETLSREAVTRKLTDWSDYARSLLTEMDDVSSPVRRLGPVYYWVDHTCTFRRNSGIQRVVRGLASALIELGVELIPVKWDEPSRKLIALSSAEMLHLAEWNGPSAAHWALWREPAASDGWILVPELTTYLSQPEMRGFREYLQFAGLRAAWIFHDAIPWKMPDMYPPAAVAAHSAYMSALNDQELVLATSDFTCADLIAYLAREPQRTPSLFERVVPCELPGEVSNQPRVREVRRKSASLVTILSVGTVEPRKNHRVLLEAFRQLKRGTVAEVQLIIAGAAPFPDLAAEITALIESQTCVRWVLSPSDAELTRLYEECDFTVYPSPEEGFGLPIMESLWYARPCVCASFGAMGEIGKRGGCLVTDVRDTSLLARSMLELVEDEDYRRELAIQATRRSFRTWREYALEVVTRMAVDCRRALKQKLPTTLSGGQLYRDFVNLHPRPKLSVCITTYNRADWLAISLRNFARLNPSPSPDVEIVVCDNASTDQTQEVVRPYLERSDFRYVRNSKNVGMLGNLRVTANEARGKYIWILGDDDLVCPGGIERVLDAISKHVNVGLVYLNYSYTRLTDASEVKNLDSFLAGATPIVAPGPDMQGPVRELCTLSENFFTAIYCLVFRRDHAVRAYTQNTDGPPFSSLLTCIPTTYYVLNFMIDESACWLGDPAVVVNMNVSWMKYAPLWILERVPEVYDLAERRGVDRAAVDRWRLHNLPGIAHFLKEIFTNDTVGNIAHFSMRRLLSRLKGLNGMESFLEPIRSIYIAAHEAGHTAARVSPEEMFCGFGGANSIQLTGAQRRV